MNLQLRHQTLGFFGRKRFIPTCRRVGVELIHYRITGEMAGGKVDQQAELTQDGEVVLHPAPAAGAPTP